MPSSYPRVIPQIIEAIDVEGWPMSVYDVGIGWGKYGFLVREYFDAFRGEIRLDGCEIFARYTTLGPAKHIYDTIQLGDWLEVRPPQLHYEIVLMVDVLEHFNEQDAVAALQKACRYGSKVIVSTPLNYPQGEVDGNPYEAHLSEWPLARIIDSGFRVVDIGSDERSVVAWVYGR